MNEKEEKTLAFWKEHKIFEKSLEKDSPNGEFVFYDGPPFATGLPHYGSLLSSIVKDVIPRYKTMRGYHVVRKWGWDCHGLPIESLVEKNLGLKTKKDIENIGVAKFNETAREMVLHYAHDWKKYIERVGRWVEFENAYKTMDNSYIQTVWATLKKINEKGLLYQGRKVLMYCPHDETPLAKAEIAMDNTYKDITEEAITVKFKVVGQGNTYFLAWTTTPWTLPANVALTLGKDIDYVKVKIGDEFFILAEIRTSVLNKEYEVAETMKGEELVGLEYEALFDVPALVSDKSYKVYAADFVNTEEGTGIVHTAVMYGEDDFALGQKENLPMVQLLDAGARYNEKAPEFLRGRYIKEAEKDIKKQLGEKIFARENHTHSYPHCYRCGNILIYNAIPSWFINIQKIKSQLLKLNETIHWVPEHLKHGRFQDITENAPDWTISRNRYWASPLPIWQNAEGNFRVVGSISELKKLSKSSGNTYFVMRHGETEGNVKQIWSCDSHTPDPLTKLGVEKVKANAEELKSKKIDIIVSSPYMRTRETASLVAQELGISPESVLPDPRLGEWNVGSEYNGKSIEKFFVVRNAYENRYEFKMPDGESYAEVLKRMGEFIYDIEQKYSGQKILIVTHGAPARALSQVAEGFTFEKLLEHSARFNNFENAEIRTLSFAPLPHNEKHELDLHRPYIDEVQLVDEDGLPLTRVPEVVDCWVESACMPFAQFGEQFDGQDFDKFLKTIPYPADFVSEYIAQTRTWFYYMHVIGTILFGDIPFKNVLTTGTILAADGSKMSKSKGNYTDPLENLQKDGADALRLYLMGSVVMAGEDLKFKDEDMHNEYSRTVNILSNCLTFFETYVSDYEESGAVQSEHILDRWIISRLHETCAEITKCLDEYDTVRSARVIRPFVTDLSTWFVRRSRDRFKSEDEAERGAATFTTRYVLLEFSKVISPFMPFIAEQIFQKLRAADGVSSVHLCEWPIVKNADNELLKEMQTVRDVVSKALELRQKAGFKVRQPLATLKIKSEKLKPELLELIKDEINVKEIISDESISEEIELDTTLTPELIEEGKVRDAIRAVQEWRKEQNLKPGEMATYDVPDSQKEVFEKHRGEIERLTFTTLIF